MGEGWLGRRRSPRLSGTLHIRDAAGRELAVPLRGRATLLTANGSGLTGYGEVHAVHTSPASDDTTLMISYGHAPEVRESGLCACGETVILGGVTFTWRHQPATIPRPRAANMPRLPIPAQPANALPPSPTPAGRFPNRQPDTTRRPALDPRPNSPT
ncbi:hypothetical protein [Actinoplanes sp. NPDC023714]|uniref:hypothetical protein n=1 Tax=Actinoplanes sp. NPDC023714 TaxID=3154322 RepID=UPI003409BEA8